MLSRLTDNFFRNVRGDGGVQKGIKMAVFSKKCSQCGICSSLDCQLLRCWGLVRSKREQPQKIVDADTSSLSLAHCLFWHVPVYVGTNSLKYQKMRVALMRTPSRQFVGVKAQPVQVSDAQEWSMMLLFCPIVITTASSWSCENHKNIPSHGSV